MYTHIYSLSTTAQPHWKIHFKKTYLQSLNWNRKIFLCLTYLGFWNIFGDRGEVSNNEGHQVSAHVNTGLFKLILHKAIGEICGFCLKYTKQGCTEVLCNKSVLLIYCGWIQQCSTPSGSIDCTPTETWEAILVIRITKSSGKDIIIIMLCKLWLHSDKSTIVNLLQLTVS